MEILPFNIQALGAFLITMFNQMVTAFVCCVQKTMLLKLKAIRDRKRNSLVKSKSMSTLSDAAAIAAAVSVHHAR